MSVAGNAIRIATGAALAIGLVTAGALPSASQESPPQHVVSVSGGAFGIQASVEGTDFADEQTASALEEAAASSDLPVLLGGTFSDSVGPVPEVTLPPTGGGPFTDTLASVALMFPEGEVTIAGPLDVSTQGALGPDGFVLSSALVEEVNQAEVTGLIFAAGSIEATCDASLAFGASGSTRIVDGLTILEPLPEDPAPNTVAIDEESVINVGAGVLTTRIFLILNEQTVGPNDITVTGARLEFFQSFEPETGGETTSLTFDETVAQARCGVVGAPVPVVVEPTFTG